MAKRIILAALFLTIITGSVFATGYPVIDISALLQSIRGYVSDFTQYTRQVQQWKSEIERAIKIAKSMSSGDWNAVLNGIKSYCAQISSWGITSGYLDNFLNNMGSSVAMGQNLLNLTKSTGAKLQSLWGSLVSGGGFNWQTGFDAAIALGKSGSYLASNAAAIGDFGQQIRSLAQAAEVMAGEKGLESLQKQLEDAQQTYQDLSQQAMDARGKDNQAEADQLYYEMQATQTQIRDLQDNIKTAKDAIEKMNERKEKLVNEALMKIAATHGTYASPEAEEAALSATERNLAATFNGIYAEEAYIDDRKTPARKSFSFI